MSAGILAKQGWVVVLLLKLCWLASILVYFQDVKCLTASVKREMIRVKETNGDRKKKNTTCFCPETAVTYLRAQCRPSVDISWTFWETAGSPTGGQWTPPESKMFKSKERRTPYALSSTVSAGVRGQRSPTAHRRWWHFRVVMKGSCCTGGLPSRQATQTKTLST